MKKKAETVEERFARVRGVYVEQRPLSEKTIQRIEAGLKKFFGKAMSSRQIKKITSVLRKRGGKKS